MSLRQFSPRVGQNAYPVHLANPVHPACVFYILGCAVANRAYGVWDVVELDTVSNMRFVLSNVRLATDMIVYQIRNSLSNIVKYFFLDKFSRLL